MFGFGSGSDSAQRARFVNWRAVGLYGLTVAVTIFAGWAVAQLG
jgi:hypothetical protein